MDYGLASAFGNRVDRMADNRDEWKRYAEEKERELNQSKAEYQKLSAKYKRFEVLDTMLGWLNEGPSVSCISAVHQMKARQMQYKADDCFWTTEKRREENLRLMAEAEYDYHVIADPVYRLMSASELLLKISGYADSQEMSEEINALVVKMQATGGVREESHRNEFIENRINELRQTVRYENDYTCTPIVDSIPEAKEFEKGTENNENWKMIEGTEDTKEFLIQDQKI